MSTSSQTNGGGAFLARYGPWALVTGASDGIGREIARALAVQGVNLILVARRGERLDQLATELGSVRTVVLARDLAKAEAVDGLIEATSGIDVGLVVAAAGFGTSGSFLRTDAVEEAAMVDVNCRAVLALAHAFAPRLARRGRGGLLLMSSIVGFQGVPGQANYAATKAYVQALAEGLAAELKRFGVDVLACAPGPVASGFAQRAGLTLAQADSARDVARGALGALGRRRLTRPGALSKVLGYSLASLPRGARTTILGQVVRGMTAGDGDGADAIGRLA